jgi:hypothetical protein
MATNSATSNVHRTAGIVIRFCRRQGDVPAPRRSWLRCPAAWSLTCSAPCPGSNPKPSSIAPACPAPRRRTGLPSAPHIKARAAARGRKSASWPAVPTLGRSTGPRLFFASVTDDRRGPAPASIRASADGRWRPRQWLRQPVRPSGARTLRAVNGPGMLAGERQRRTLRPASWPAAGRPGMGRGARRPRRRGYPQLHSPLASTVSQAAELRLCPNPPQPYAHIVILAAQKAANRHK